MTDDSVKGELFQNYFNYFTEIEEHFQRARSTSLFLLSPLDWALIESWKNSGVPLEAVLRGIDVAFEKWRSGRSRVQMVNSLAYCTQAIMTETQRMANAGEKSSSTRAAEPFPAETLRDYIFTNAAALRRQQISEVLPIADSLDQIASGLEETVGDLEHLEQHLTVLEEKLIAIGRSRETEEQALASRRDLETYLRPWRGKMTAPQIVMLQTQFLDRATLETAGFPRLSLFYLR